MANKNYVIYTVSDSKSLKTIARDILEVDCCLNEDLSMEVYDRVKEKYPTVFTRNNEDNLSVTFSNFNGKSNIFY